VHAVGQQATFDLGPYRIGQFGHPARIGRQPGNALFGKEQPV